MNRQLLGLAFLLGIGALTGTVATRFIQGGDLWTSTKTASVLENQASASSSTILSDGRILKVGEDGGGRLMSTAEILSSDHHTINHTTPIRIPRRFHSATAMPDGRVLVWGGSDAQGKLILRGEWFDPRTNTFSDAGDLPLTPRAGHSATILTDGRLLIAGGWSSEVGAFHTAELFDPVTARINQVDAPVGVGRSATLIADGRVVFQDGYDESGRKLTGGAIFDPGSDRFEQIDRSKLLSTLQPLPTAAPKIVESLPGPDTKNALVDQSLTLRFSTPMDPLSINKKTLTLTGPQGSVDVTVQSAEEGRLAFITPASDLLPASLYSLYVNGVRAANGDKAPLAAITFNTTTLHANDSVPASRSSNAAAPIIPMTMLTAGTVGPGASGNAKGNDIPASMHHEATISDGEWHPGTDSFYGQWRVNRPQPPIPAFTTLRRHLPEHATALYGQVLQMDDQPVANVQVTVGGLVTQTDAQGLFLLVNAPAGRQELFVDGTKAGFGKFEYGQIVLGVDVEPGHVNILPQQVFLPKISAADRIAIDSPTTHDIVITHPELPGLEIHVPAGTVFRDHKGRIVRTLALVPTPLDRAPYPVPDGFPMYFTLQPGGASILGLTPDAAKGVRVVYPNYLHAPAGSETSFWVYDPLAGWKSYGKGVISKDGRQVLPDKGVTLYAEMGAGYCIGSNCTPPPPPPPPGPPPPPPPPPPPCPGPPPPPSCCSGGGPPPSGSGGGSGGSFGQGGPAGGGDPVDLSTGLFTLSRTDLAIDDVVPISATRVYRQGDVASRAFGYGMSLNYGMYLYNPGNTYNTPELVLPNGSLIVFNRTSGSSYSGSWAHTATDSQFYGAVLSSSGTSSEAYYIQLKDGTQYTFNPLAPNALTAIRDRYGNTITFTYGSSGITKVTSPSGRYLSFTYDGSKRITAITDHTGRSVSYSYNSLGTLQTVTYPDGTTEQYTYDSNRNMLTVQDRNGHVIITNQYDSNDRVQQQTLADNAVYQFAYTPNGTGAISQTNVTDPAGIVRQVLFDAGGYPIQDTYGYGQADAQSYSFQRGPNTELISSKTDPLGRVIQYSYDSEGNVLTRTDLAGTANAETFNFTYTQDYNRLASITDPLNHTTSYSYTAGCLTKIKDALGNTTTFTCNGSGQRTSTTDPLGHTTLYGYNGYDLSSVTDALSRTTTYYRDDLARVVSSIDPLGETSLASYDVNDRIVSTTDGNGYTTLYGHDSNGNQTSITDPAGGVISFTYDSRNRVASRTDALLHRESWTYDGLGNWLSSTDRNGQLTTSAYDDLRRLASLAYADNSSIQFGYDAGNRIISIVDSVSGTISRSYDGINNLTQEQTPLGNVSYAYDLANRRISMQAVGQPATSYAYDASNRLMGLTLGAESVAYSYDAASRVMSLTLPNGVQTTYSFDNANELIGLNYLTSAATTLGALVYTYDNTGRRISVTGSWSSDQLPNATTTNYQYNAENQITGGNSYAPVFDNSGQLLQDGQGNSYTWNARHQLVQVVNGPAVLASFQYDGLGRRVEKTIGAITTGYLYDRQNPIQEQQAGTINNLLTGLGIDQFYARTDTSGRMYFLSDAINSTIALTDSSGNVQQQYAYDPFGNYVVKGPGTGFTNPYTYTGREDDGIGLYFFRARYYSPGLQRFISEDPIGLEGGPNVYAYVKENPISKMDPLGLKDTFQNPAPGAPKPDSCLLPNEECHQAYRRYLTYCIAVRGVAAGDNCRLEWAGWFDKCAAGPGVPECESDPPLDERNELNKK